MTAIEKHRKSWPGKSDEWLFERLDNELKQKVERIHELVEQTQSMATEILNLEKDVKDKGERINQLLVKNVIFQDKLDEAIKEWNEAKK